MHSNRRRLLVFPKLNPWGEITENASPNFHTKKVIKKQITFSLNYQLEMWSAFLFESHARIIFISLMDCVNLFQYFSRITITINLW